MSVSGVVTRRLPRRPQQAIRGLGRWNVHESGVPHAASDLGRLGPCGRLSITLARANREDGRIRGCHRNIRVARVSGSIIRTTQTPTRSFVEDNANNVRTDVAKRPYDGSSVQRAGLASLDDEDRRRGMCGHPERVADHARWWGSMTIRSCAVASPVRTVRARWDASSSAGLGGIVPLVSSDRLSNSVACMLSNSATRPAFGWTIRSLNPPVRDLRNKRCRLGLRMSASIRSTRLSELASATARLAAVQLLPSPGRDDVITKLVISTSGVENRT